MEFDHPPDDAYGRVTDPQKFGVVVEAAEAMIVKLENDFEVRRVAVGTSEFGGDWSIATRVVSLEPSTGATLQFGFTDFPGVIMRFGRWRVEAFPVCGCDACDPDPAGVVEQLEGQSRGGHGRPILGGADQGDLETQVRPWMGEGVVGGTTHTRGETQAWKAPIVRLPGVDATLTGDSTGPGEDLRGRGPRQRNQLAAMQSALAGLLA